LAADLHIDPRRLELDLEKVSCLEGQPFTVRVPCSGHTSALGREMKYWQFQLLVLHIEFADGKSTYVTVDIPDGRVAREVAVSMP
jgi:hypothetical protein